MTKHQHWHLDEYKQWYSVSCWALHPKPKVDYKKWVAVTGFFLFFTLAVHLILKSNGL